MHVIPSSTETIFEYQRTMAPDPPERNLTEQLTKYAGHIKGDGDPSDIA